MPDWDCVVSAEDVDFAGVVVSWHGVDCCCGYSENW